MSRKNQPDRWEATLLAAVMAVAGVPFLFDRLGALVRTSVLSFPALAHSAPVLLVAVGAILLLAEQDASHVESGNRTESQGGRYEL
jgi:hypothetical protein